MKVHKTTVYKAWAKISFFYKKENMFVFGYNTD